MKIAVLGGDGYCGWATALYLSARGHSDRDCGQLCAPPMGPRAGRANPDAHPPAGERLRAGRKLTGKTHRNVCRRRDRLRFSLHDIQAFEPDAVVHFAEQRSAPYSMIDRKHAVFTQVNNVVGTLNLLFALREFLPDCHLIKLGTMGEYGTPNIDIEEGYIEIEHNGRKDVLPYPKQPGSFYHLSKVHDSHNIMFACKIWGLRATDLNQGVVYGTMTDEVAHGRGPDQPLRLRRSVWHGAEPLLRAGGHRTSADGIRQGRADARASGYSRHGALHRNRLPESGGAGRMPRLQPVHRAVFSAGTGAHGAGGGEESWDSAVEIDHLPDPRVEAEAHYYNAKHSKLIDLGLQPHLLSDSLLDSLMNIALRYRDRIDLSLMLPQVNWRRTHNERSRHVRPAATEPVSEGRF